MQPARNTLLLIKSNGERFAFIYDGNSREELLRQFGVFAADPELSFSWVDAEVLSQQASKQTVMKGCE